MSHETKTKVLLIDDEEFVRDIYSVKFLRSGFDVFVCSSVDEAILRLRAGYEADVIIFDITMPDKNGYQFLEELAQVHLKKPCLKIALTNEGQVGEIQRMLELGADVHLVKARYTPREVVEVVNAMLKERSATSHS